MKGVLGRLFLSPNCLAVYLQNFVGFVVESGHTTLLDGVSVGEIKIRARPGVCREGRKTKQLSCTFPNGIFPSRYETSLRSTSDSLHACGCFIIYPGSRRYELRMSVVGEWRSPFADRNLSANLSFPIINIWFGSTHTHTHAYPTPRRRLREQP